MEGLGVAAPLAPHTFSKLPGSYDTALPIGRLLGFAATDAVRAEFTVAIAELLDGLRLPAD